MNQQEFTARVGEQYANEFTHAEALYMALPNTDKDRFCALWKLEKETGLIIFAKLARWVSAYKYEMAECETFAAFARPFHESKLAHELEAEINRTAAAIQAEGAAMNSCPAHA